jgi:hypothetical protein
LWRFFCHKLVLYVSFFLIYLKEEGRRKREEGRRKREEGRGKKEEGRRKREEAIKLMVSAINNNPFCGCSNIVSQE